MKTSLGLNTCLLALALASIAAVPHPSEKANTYLSTDHGVSWQPADKGLPVDERLNVIVVHNRLVFAGTDRHGVWLMDKNGWSIQSNGLPKSSRVLSLLSSNHILYAGLYHGGLYFSTDDGYTWKKVNQNPDANVRAISEFKGGIYAGTDVGIYRIDIKSETWTLLLGRQQINTFASNGNYIYGGTHQGAVRSTDGVNWEQVFEGAAISKIAFNENEVTIMDLEENVFRGLLDKPTFVREDIYLPHTHYFRLTPKSGKLIGIEWSDISFYNPSNRRGLPGNKPLNLLVRTPFGLLAASSGGC
ncbi:hypothetical protein WBG78_00060 [Chryseolinea sp. T2]|uniref:WD40/YVTN/BNR-like repeat-containing protein n=1 Tax=Chryseolinea sp. T2 TaxID=3129255 RepID=UPI003076A8D1